MTTDPYPFARAPKGRRKGWVAQQSVLFYRTARVLTGLLYKYWVRHYHAIGVENVPPTGGIFMIANHTSSMDPFFLCYPLETRIPRGPGKVELFKNRLAAYILYRSGIFPIRSGEADAASVRAMVELYRGGCAVVVFPEGARSDDGQLMPFSADFARLAIKLRAPIVPLAMAGANEVLPVGALIPRPNVAITVVYGEPFELSEFYGHKPTAEDAERAAQIMHDWVAALLEIARNDRIQRRR